MLRICVGSFSTYHSVLLITVSVLAIGRISTQHAVLLCSTSVIAMSKAPNILLSVDYLSFSPSNRQGPILSFTIAYFSFSLSQGMIITYY